MWFWDFWFREFLDFGEISKVFCEFWVCVLRGIFSFPVRDFLWEKSVSCEGILSFWVISRKKCVLWHRGLFFENAVSIRAVFSFPRVEKWTFKEENGLCGNNFCRDWDLPKGGYVTVIFLFLRLISIVRRVICKGDFVLPAVRKNRKNRI